MGLPIGTPPLTIQEGQANVGGKRMRKSDAVSLRAAVTAGAEAAEHVQVFRVARPTTNVSVAVFLIGFHE
jgi:hypothetical protein